MLQLCCVLICSCVDPTRMYSFVGLDVEYVLIAVIIQSGLYCILINKQINTQISQRPQEVVLVVFYTMFYMTMFFQNSNVFMGNTYMYSSCVIDGYRRGGL